MTPDNGQNFLGKVFAGLAKGFDGEVAWELKKRFFSLVGHFELAVCLGGMMLIGSKP